MNCIKYIVSRRAMLGASTHIIIPSTLTLQPNRRLTTQGIDLVSSSSPLKYDYFFPSFCGEYVSKLLECNTSTEGDTFWVNEPAIKRHFESKPHYSFDDDFNNNDPIDIQEGHHFDVISLLFTHGDHLIRIGSNNPVKATDSRGKYILFFCAFVPSIWTDSYTLRHISTLTSEMFQTRIGCNNFEVVIVPKMRQKWDNDEGVFFHFISAFKNCLVVPFIHKYRCDYICKSLNFEGEPKFVFVDPTQKVLQVGYEYIVEFGARGFPFTHEHLRSLYSEDCWRSGSPSVKSLPGLLCCESNPCTVLRKFDSEETISVEQLNKHHVGLYMFDMGHSLQTVKYIHQQCRDQGIDFEIMLVCFPSSICLDPEVHQDLVFSILKKHQISDWWVFPYNNSACRRLHHLHYSCTDVMFMVGPDNKFVDRQAGDMLVYFGPHFGSQVFPFTMKALLQAFLQRLDKVTLDTFLTYEYVYRDYECDDGKIYPVSELRGKNVVVYVTSCWQPGLENKLKEHVMWCNKIKEKDPDFEVLVPVLAREPDSEYQKYIPAIRECIFKSRTKWRVCPFHDAKQSRALRNNDAFLFRPGTSNRVAKGVPINSTLAFGSDGHLHSLKALRLLHENGLDAYPFVGEGRSEILSDEITRELKDQLEVYDDTVVSL